MSIAPPANTVFYPDSDGKPMADNTKQFAEITSLMWNLEALFADRDDVFVAGDLLWYPTEGHPEIRQAPDALVAFGRPRGHRGSYRQWEEGGIAPQVVFEILSPGNRVAEMLRKHGFYERYGVQEYYVYDPDDFEFTVCLRTPEGALVPEENVRDFRSPRLGVRFAVLPGQPWRVYRPDGERFKNYVEMLSERDAERARADAAEGRADAERARAARLEERLKALGEDPDR